MRPWGEVRSGSTPVPGNPWPTQICAASVTSRVSGLTRRDDLVAGHRDPERRPAVTSSGQASRYPGGRPRDPQVDAAITRSALELLIERGAAATSIEQVAQRANITKATVYRRFGKTELLVYTVAAVFEPSERGGLEWRSLEQMVNEWAGFLSRPKIGRVLRRLYSSAEEYPELLEVAVAGETGLSDQLSAFNDRVCDGPPLRFGAGLRDSAAAP
jgi:AcrR family transcriptional regulator